MCVHWVTIVLRDLSILPFARQETTVVSLAQFLVHLVQQEDTALRALKILMKMYALWVITVQQVHQPLMPTLALKEHSTMSLDQFQC